jgi:dolichyl-phosphate-mannose--protein O-mannosyl transferase
LIDASSSAGQIGTVAKRRRTKPSLVSPPPENAGSAAQDNGVDRGVDQVITLLCVVSAFALYLWRLAVPDRYIYDEVYHAFTARQLASGNGDAYVWYTKAAQPGVAYEWVHPALAKLPMQLGILLFGEDSFGWRFASALFGALGIGILYGLGRTLLGRRVGLLAAALLLLDGMWFVQSRTAMNDVFVVCFVMLAYLTFYGYLTLPEPRAHRYLWASGIFLGLAIATKWSACWSLGLLGLIALVRETRRSSALGWKDAPARLARMAGVFVGAPLLLYVGGYAQFFIMGHTVREWIELQRQMLWYHTHLKATHEWASRWWSWPLLLRPVWYHFADEGSRVSHIFALGNPALWWLFVPAVLYIAGWLARLRPDGAGASESTALALVLAGFFGQWIPWALSPRISYLYHMLPSVPFGCLAIAWILTRPRLPRALAWAYLLVVAASFVYFYPHYAAWPLSRAASAQRFWLKSWDPFIPARPTTGASQR